MLTDLMLPNYLNQSYPSWSSYLTLVFTVLSWLNITLTNVIFILPNSEFPIPAYPHVPGIVTHVSAHAHIRTHGYESHNLCHTVYKFRSSCTKPFHPFPLLIADSKKWCTIYNRLCCLSFLLEGWNLR